MNHNFCKKMDDFSRSYYEQNKNSGIIRVTLKDEIIYENSVGFANIENRTPFKTDSVFTLYSISKPFCAMGLLKLKDKDLVNLDSHPSKYVPEAKGFDSRVTIRHLLQHISGLPDFVQTAKFNQKYLHGKSEELRAHLAHIADYPMLFEPGKNEMYANVNYILCALIIENVSGLEYSQYMKNEVFTPLGMKSAQVDNGSVSVCNKVTGYEIENEKIIPVSPDLNWMLGAGDIVGTLDDVYCLNKAVKHKLLLKPETWQEVLTPSPLNSMGLGCTISKWHGKTRITHNGGSRGFRTMHVQIPNEDFDIILLSNCGWGEARNDYAEAVYEAYFGSDSGVSDKVRMDVGYI